MNRKTPQNPVLMAMLAALAPLVGHSAPAIAAPVTPSAFAIPDHAWILTREVRRPLPDGSEIVARRRFALTFAPNRDGKGGAVIEGRQIDCEVDAPAHLGALADLERRRVEAGLFPLHIDANGMIVEARRTMPSPTAEPAIGVASQWLSVSSLEAGDKLQAQAFLASLKQRDGAGSVPRDLFRPVPGKRQETRNLALPGGADGSVTVTSESRAQADGLLAWSERTVVTDFAGTREVSRESWWLDGPSVTP